MRWNELYGRLWVWIRRYGPPELLGSVAAVAAAVLTHRLGGNVLAAAFAANWAEFVCYYGLIAWRSLPAGKRRSPRAALLTLRDLLIEFGPAELICSVVRPALLFAAMALTPSPALGALLGKLLADLCFYLPAVVAYELRERLLSGETRSVSPSPLAAEP